MMAAKPNHYVRRQKRLIESTGARVAGFALTRGGHLRFVVITPDGAEHRMICGSTPSDYRANKNMLARVRRWCATPAANQPAPM